MMKPVSLLIMAAALSFAQTAPPSPSANPGNAGEHSPIAAPDVASLQAKLDRNEKILQDWANLGRYRNENTELAKTDVPTGRVVFMGDSITDGWGRRYGQFFPGKPYVNRGISGQTTPQMLVRFRPDVINLHPQAVVILAGTNDIAGNTGPETLEDIENNLSSMAELARVNHIKVILASVTPVTDAIRPQTARRPPEKIVALNQWIKSYCEQNGHTYLDYYSATIDDAKMFKAELTYDGLHPNARGYEIMGPLAQQAIDKALQSSR